MEFMFMDDSTTAQIAPSGDFASTQTINCDNPLMSATQKAVICAGPNLINGYLGTFPLAVSAGYNPNPGDPVIDYSDGQGGTYNKAFFQPLRRNVEGGPRQGQFEHTTYRAVLGVKGDLGDAWNYNAYYQFGRVNYSQVYVNELSIARLNKALDVVTDNRVGSATYGEPVCRSVITGTDANCVPYDIFAGKGGASQAAVNYLSASGYQRGHTQEQVISASITGDLGKYGFQSPGAMDGVQVNFGVEWRKEELDLKVDQEFETGDLTGQGGPTLPLNGSFKVLEFFGETQIPLVQDGFVKDFSLSAGYRYSHYTTSSGSNYNTDTFKIGADLAPVDGIRFRGMFNRAVRAPNIQELFAAVNVNLDGSEDPCAGITITATDYGCIAQGLAVGQGTPANPAAQYNGKLGGNPLLQPEKADTWTFGVVLQPSMVPHLALTVDYFNIKLTDAIRSFGADAILSDCVAKATASFTPSSCDLVHRDVAGSIWLTPGGYVTDLPGNVGSVQTAGIEINGSYMYPLNFGSLNLTFQGTYLDKYKVDNGLTEPYDCAGYYGGTCSAGGTTDSGAPLPRWRHKARLSLQTDSNIGVSLQWRYVGSVEAETFSPSSTLAGSVDYYGKGQHIGAQSYFDLAASYTYHDNYKLRLGVNNIFDKQPPYVPQGTLCPTGPCNGNTYPGTWDALGRYFYAGVTLDF
jgi:outer membrane receptor protein involved in Fe transport